MRCLDFFDFDNRRQFFDELVRTTPEGDHFCSSSDWIIPAREAFAEDADACILEDAAGMIALMAVPIEGWGRTLVPLESSWGFALPFAGAEPTLLVERLYYYLTQSSDAPKWESLLIPGLEPEGRTLGALVRWFAPEHRIGLGPTMLRHRAQIDGGFEGWRNNRTPKFLRNMRLALRRAESAGVDRTYIVPSTVDDFEQAFERALNIELRGWKGASETGFGTPPMQFFYRRVCERLLDTKSLRFVFVRAEGIDIGFAFGAVRDNLFRGFQLGYADSHRHLSPGNLAQLSLIEELANEGVAIYDLGMDMEYKRGWADTTFQTVSILISRPPANTFMF